MHTGRIGATRSLFKWNNRMINTPVPITLSNSFTWHLAWRIKVLDESIGTILRYWLNHFTRNKNRYWWFGYFCQCWLFEARDVYGVGLWSWQQLQRLQTTFIWVPPTPRRPKMIKMISSIFSGHKRSVTKKVCHKNQWEWEFHLTTQLRESNFQDKP